MHGGNDRALMRISVESDSKILFARDFQQLGVFLLTAAKGGQKGHCVLGTRVFFLIEFGLFDTRNKKYMTTRNLYSRIHRFLTLLSCVALLAATGMTATAALDQHGQSCARSDLIQQQLTITHDDVMETFLPDEPNLVLSIYRKVPRGQRSNVDWAFLPNDPLTLSRGPKDIYAVSQNLNSTTMLVDQAFSQVPELFTFVVGPMGLMGLIMLSRRCRSGGRQRS